MKNPILHNGTRRIPKRIEHYTLRYMEQYNLGLADAFEEAVRTYAPESSSLYRAFMAGCDFRRWLPQIYVPESLDFEKFPDQWK